MAVRSGSLWRVELRDVDGNLVDFGTWRSYRGVAERDMGAWSHRAKYLRNPQLLQVVEKGELRDKRDETVEDLDWLYALAAQGGLPQKV